MIDVAIDILRLSAPILLSLFGVAAAIAITIWWDADVYEPQFHLIPK